MSHKPLIQTDNLYVHLELDYSGPASESVGLTTKQANLAILRGERYKLVHFNALMEPLLFDLKLDPDEMKSFAQDPEYADVMLNMTRELLSHRMRHMAPVI